MLCFQWFGGNFLKRAARSVRIARGKFPLANPVKTRLRNPLSRDLDCRLNRADSGGRDALLEFFRSLLWQRKCNFMVEVKTC
jgi:hypothetical protein